jgi:hypothetical protein
LLGGINLSGKLAQIAEDLRLGLVAADSFNHLLRAGFGDLRGGRLLSVRVQRHCR